jgi:glyoxylase-like metal-dependent hydrolase (beta-lactamase superfamily II)
MLFLDVFPVGPIQANCILLGDSEAGSLAVIDPGEEAERITERIEASGLAPAMVLHTHGHIDHAGGTADLHRRLGDEVPIGLHRDELQLYLGLQMQGRMFGIEAQTPPQPTLWLEHGQRIALGGLVLEVRHTPGHSAGGVSFVVHGAPEPMVIVGDVLFAGSIGRTDLFGGSFPILERSIREQIYSLADETRVICGHGPETTVGREKASNPFVRA